MHMQPIYRTSPFITVEGNGRDRTNAYISGDFDDVGADIFRRGLCLLSDNKMKPEEQDRIIEIIHSCFLRIREYRLNVNKVVAGYLLNMHSVVTFFKLIVPDRNAVHKSNAKK